MMVFSQLYYNITFVTYARLMNMSDEEMQEIAPDYIVLDEFHRCGAVEWGRGIERFLSIHQNIPMLGLSATAIRYLDNQRDMSDEPFDGHVASEMSLGESIVRGILNPPKYVLSLYSYQEELNKYGTRARRSKSKAVRNKAEEYIEQLRRALNKAEGLSTNLNKNFIAIANNENPVRTQNLLSKIGLLDRINLSPTQYTEIDYSSVNEIIAEIRSDSQEWIMEMVET